MSFLACLASFVGLAGAFDLLRAVRDLLSFSMSLTASSVFVDFSFERVWISLDVDFVRERAGMTMTVRVKEQEKFKLRTFRCGTHVVPTVPSHARVNHVFDSPRRGPSSTLPTVSSISSPHTCRH